MCMYIRCNYLMMCVHWDLGQSISEQAYLCVEAGDSCLLR